MNTPPPPDATPRSLLEAWDRLSSAESEAIQAGNWGHLERLHAALRRIVDRLMAVLDEGLQQDPVLNTLAQGITARARANLARVELHKQDVLQESSVLERTRWNLRRQQSSFVRPPSGSWQRYS